MQSNSLKRNFVLFLILTPFLVYLYLLNKHAVNLPYRDSYRLFVNYIILYIKAPLKLPVILVPENESYPVLMRLLSIIQYKIDGALNFSHLMLFFNTFLIFTVVVITFHYYKRKEYLPIAFLSLLIFNVFHYESFFRNEVAGYQLAVFPFTVLIFYSATVFEKLKWPVKILFYFSLLLNPLGSINGLIANLMVWIYFLIKKVSKKDTVFISIIIFFQLVFLIWLKDQGKSVSIFENLWKYNFELVYAFFVSLGGLLAVSLYQWFLVLVALVSAFIFFYTCYQCFFVKGAATDFEKLLLIFTTISLAAIVVLRYNYWMIGIAGVLESRYKLYGAFIFLIFAAIVSRKHGRLQYLTLFSLVIIYILGLLKGGAGLKNQMAERVMEVYNSYQGVYEDRFANENFVSRENRDFLEKNNIYSFEKYGKRIALNFNDNRRLTDISSSEIKIVSDPITQGDWGGFKKQLNKFTLTGIFPKHKYYFVKFKVGDNKSYAMELKPLPKPLLERLITKEDYELKLEGDFYPGPVTGIDLDDFKVYGVDQLAL